MNELLQKINEAVSFLLEKDFTDCEIGVVLGTGLGSLVNRIKDPVAIPYTQIPHFPTSTVEFHKGQLIKGYIGNKKVLVMQGRFHYYEGYSMQEITFPIRIMEKLGVRQLFLSNAAGGININFKKGDLVVTEDHINLQPENPLRGLNDPAFGNRFVDMAEPYDPNLNNGIFKQAEELAIQVKKGIYAAVAGPNLETRAEYRYIRSIGADMVGMSTVPEVIVANQLGVRCASISVITDECDPDNLKPVNIAEIIEVAGKADQGLSKLVEKVIASLL